MKILFLIPYPLNEAPSQRFRFEQYQDLLQEKGFWTSFQSFWDEKTWSILYKPAHTLGKIAGFVKGVGRRLFILSQLSKIDFVFVHRECLPIGPPVIEWIITKILKKKIIFDFDDAIWLPNTSFENRFASLIKWHSKARSICKWSYRVSCGNLFLADFARKFNENVVINPTTIETENFHKPNLYTLKKNPDCITIGWTGSHSTLLYLHSLVSVFEKLEKKFSGKWRLLIIADKAPGMKLSYMEFRPWSKKREMEDLLQFDIGIMPLPDGPWEKGKCGFKALQYMALEIPAVVSPVGVNVKIVKDGVNGFLCDHELEWTEKLGLLMENLSLRTRLGKEARKTIETNYSVASNTANFLSLFD